MSGGQREGVSESGQQPHASVKAYTLENVALREAIDLLTQGHRNDV